MVSLRSVLKFCMHLAICAVLTLLLMEGILRFFPVRQVPHTAELSDASPIPRHVENMSGIWSRDWNFSIVNRININNYGYVNAVTYDKHDTSPLVAVIGDSFVAALMVPHAETFHARLAAHFGGNVRVYSFGLSGAPLATYLKLAQFVEQEFNPDYIIFTIITNDYDESYFKYKRFPAFYYFYPRPDGSLYLDKADFFITPWRRNLVRSSRLMAYLTQNVQIRDRIKDLIQGGKELVRDHPYDIKRLAESKNAIDFFMEQLQQTVTLDKTRILFVVDAVDEFIYDDNVDLDSRPGFELSLNTFFIIRARRLHYPLVSLQDIFAAHYRQHGQRFDYPSDGHWNPMAHEIVSDSILQSGFLKEYHELSAPRATSQ
jgi:hypothetical protein